MAPCWETFYPITFENLLAKSILQRDCPWSRCLQQQDQRRPFGQIQTSLCASREAGGIFISAPNCLVPLRRTHQQKRPSATSWVKAQGSMAEMLVPAWGIPAKIRIRSSRWLPPGLSWGREGPCLYLASCKVQHPTEIPPPLRRDAQISLICR